MISSTRRAKSGQETASQQNLFRRLYRQTHNICKRAPPSGYDEIAALLNAIRSGLVERVNDLKVGVDHGIVKWLEHYFAAYALIDFQLVDRSTQRNAREYGVRAASEPMQHGARFFKVSGFVEDAIVNEYCCICA